MGAALLSLSWHPVARFGICAGLISIFVGANDWPRAQHAMDLNGHAVYWVSIAAFGLLVWLAGLSAWEPVTRRVRDWSGERAGRVRTGPLRPYLLASVAVEAARGAEQERGHE